MSDFLQKVLEIRNSVWMGLSIQVRTRIVGNPRNDGDNGWRHRS
jgi:hypothetical protein